MSTHQISGGIHLHGHRHGEKEAALHNVIFMEGESPMETALELCQWNFRVRTLKQWKTKIKTLTKLAKAKLQKDRPDQKSGEQTLQEDQNV